MKIRRYGFLDYLCDFHENENGDYVDYSSYETLQKENIILREGLMYIYNPKMSDYGPAYGAKKAAREALTAADKVRSE